MSQNSRLRKLAAAAGGPAAIARRMSTQRRPITPERVSMWIARGKPSAQCVEAFAEVLGVSPASLRGDLYRRARA